MLRTPVSCRINPARGYEAKPQPIETHRNPNVSKILPLTALRIIDLGGRKISGRLFSIFWAESKAFFEVFLHQNMCKGELLPDPHQTIFAWRPVGRSRL